MYARIRPFNPRRGATTKTYVVAGNIFRVGERGADGWYEVGSKLALYLKTLRTDPANEESPLVFDVVDTLEEANALTGAAVAKLATPGQTAPAKPFDPGADLRSADVRANGRRPALSTDDDPGMSAAPTASPGEGDPEMAATPVIPGAPKKKPAPAPKTKPAPVAKAPRA